MHLIVLLVLVALVSYCSASAGASQPESTPTPTPTAAPTQIKLATATPQPTATATPTPRPTQPPAEPLKPETVQSWCKSDVGRCVPQRFAQLVEETNAVSPHTVVVKVCLPISMNVPKGKQLRVRYSDCNNNTYQSYDGGNFPQVCAMTIRQFR